MNNIGTIFNTSDNSGIKKLKNINILDKNKKLKIKNKSVSVIKKGKNMKYKLKKSDIINVLIVVTKRYNFYLNNGTIFNKNSTVLTKNDKLNCTKLKGFISSIIKDKVYRSKINLKKAKFI